MPTKDGERVIPGRLAITVFATVVLLILIVLGAQLIPKAQRPTIRPAPRNTTTTITIPASTSP